MAFIFNPNPSEGDKQTNPDTGVEYIYSGGAWRALGAKIEDEFDTLDDRYIKLNGRSDVGDAYTIKGPGENPGATSTFHQIKDGKQYLYHIDTPQDSNTEWVANVSYVKSKTDDKMSKQGTQTINSDHWKIIQPNQDGNNRSFIDIYDGSMNLYNVADPTDGADGWAANKKYVQSHVDEKIAAIPDVDLSEYYKKTGGTITGSIAINRGEKPHPQFKITPNAGTTNFATNIYSLGDGDMRFRTSHTDNEEDHVGSHIVLHANGGSPETKIYNVVQTGDTGAVPKSYVDEKVASAGGGVPVGSIMMWINAIAPSGWLKLKGGSFDINAYPLLHAYLQQSDGYVSGKLPDWRGHYPGQIGDHLNGDVGIKLPQQTAKPSGGSPHSSSSFNNGENKTANKAGSSDFAGIRKGQVSIDSGWDEVTRPKTVAVHFIIKHD